MSVHFSQMQNPCEDEWLLSGGRTLRLLPVKKRMLASQGLRPAVTVKERSGSTLVLVEWNDIFVPFSRPGGFGESRVTDGGCHTG